MGKFVSIIFMVVLFLCNVPEVDGYTFLMSGFQRARKGRQVEKKKKKLR